MNNLPGSTNIPTGHLARSSQINSQIRGLTHLFPPAAEHLWTATPQWMAVYQLHQITTGKRV